MNMLIDIATARNRNARRWKNEQVDWEDIARRMLSVHRTAESYDEYMGLPPSRQAEIKDIGGFVGGFLVDGRRKNANVLYRQIVSLDVDFASPDFWLDFTLTYGCEAVLHTTHKHSPKAPRFRLLIPLSRAVTAEEYQPLARKIAGNLGIELFDEVSFRRAQIMYWPSASSDGEFLSERQVGEWLDPDTVLAEYRDFRDASAWPVSSKFKAKVDRSMQKQGEPTEKPGYVGAFCRAYTMTEALETVLAPYYEPTDQPDRWTFKGGTTVAGLVIYEDKFAYSHHGSDPASERLCNAFDLVRLHLYGDEDKDAPEDAPVSKLPSYKLMQEFASTDAVVKAYLAKERLQEAQERFTDVAFDDTVGAEVNTEWMAALEMDKKTDAIRPTAQNLVHILRNDPNLKGCFALDMFENRPVVLKSPPWRSKAVHGRYFNKYDAAQLRTYIEKIYDISAPNKLKDAFDGNVVENAYHPVRDYLNGLKAWDGVERLDTMLCKYLGAEDSPYTRAVTRKAFTAAAARVMEPGCKFDYVLTFVGAEGLGKSTLLAKMGGAWFSDSVGNVTTKEAAEQIQGAWIIEMAEMVAVHRAEVQAVKNFVGKTVDRFRPSYAEFVDNYPRQCVFFGTTNEDESLRGVDGNRRFWPVRCGETEAETHPRDLTVQEVAQLWAEALHYYNEGEPLYLDDELEAHAREVQADHLESDARVGMIEAFLEKPVCEGWYDMSHAERRFAIEGGTSANMTVERETACLVEVYTCVFGGQLKDMNRAVSLDLSKLMKRVKGWQRGKIARFGNFGVQKSWVKIENVDNEYFK